MRNQNKQHRLSVNSRYILHVNSRIHNNTIRNQRLGQPQALTPPPDKILLQIDGRRLQFMLHNSHIDHTICRQTTTTLRIITNALTIDYNLLPHQQTMDRGHDPGHHKMAMEDFSRSNMHKRHKERYLRQMPTQPTYILSSVLQMCRGQAR